MLGCQDFCGHYEWTFHYVRRTCGQQAVRDLWAQAIGADSQRHYSKAALRAGLRGLLEVWTQTGQEESCDWTFQLDEARNILRWDMRQCPSKGFLLDNDLNADEDYCDHCMGWIIPLLDRVGAEVVGHEHNHRGQCWGEMRMKDRPCSSLDTDKDIRRDPRWKEGYLHRFRNNIQLPLLNAPGGSPDPCEVLTQWSEPYENVTVLGDSAQVESLPVSVERSTALCLTDSAYAGAAGFQRDPVAVLIGQTPRDLSRVAQRFRATDPARRPLLLHTYRPRGMEVDFASAGLPRAVPILPQLIRSGMYEHRPGVPPPATDIFLALLASSLGKPVFLAGLDQDCSSADEIDHSAPRKVRCDLDYLADTVEKSQGRVAVGAEIARLLMVYQGGDT